MKNITLSAMAFSIPLLSLAACDDRPDCRYDETLVRVSDVTTGAQWACMPRRPTSGSPSASPAPSTSTAAGGASAPSSGGTTAPPIDSGSSGSTPPGGACGGVGPAGDIVRVVDKSDPSPTFQSGGAALADGAYDLVQASFFRTGASDSPVRSLKATLTVHGATLTLGAQDLSVAGQPTESLSFLVGQGSLTKTCESARGTVSAWFFPFLVGGSGQTQIFDDGNSGFLRVVVSRADGATELVFAR
jgi:hypothetical protein